MKLFKNIKSFFPKNSKDTERYTNICNRVKGPTFISLKTDKYITKW